MVAWPSNPLLVTLAWPTRNCRFTEPGTSDAAVSGIFWSWSSPQELHPRRLILIRIDNPSSNRRRVQGTSKITVRIIPSWMFNPRLSWTHDGVVLPARISLLKHQITSTEILISCPHNKTPISPEIIVETVPDYIRSPINRWHDATIMPLLSVFPKHY